MRKLIAILALLLQIAVGQDIAEMYEKVSVAEKAGNQVEAERILDAIVAELKRGRPESSSWIVRVLSDYWSLGRPAKANRLYRWALADSRRRQNIDQTEDLLLWKGVELHRNLFQNTTKTLDRSLYEEAGTTLREYLALSEAHTRDRGLESRSYALGRLAYIEEALGHLKEAESAFRRQETLPTNIYKCPPCAVCERLAPGTWHTTYPDNLADFYLRQANRRRRKSCIGGW